MDVTLLSRMIGELMPGLDTLSLPGLGTFTAEQVSASFSDKGYTINPPYRRLSFTGTQTDDGHLAGLYATSNGVSGEEADAIIRSFTATLGKELTTRGSIELPGLGRLRSTREGHLFFVPDEDLDISPEACGLTSVSLKFHSVSTEFGTVLETVKKEIDEEIQVQGNDKNAFGIGKEAPVSDAVGDENESKTGDAVGSSNRSDNKKEPRKTHRKPSKAFYYLALPILAAALILGGFAALSRLAPAFTDKLLYTPEQLEIINTPEWN